MNETEKAPDAVSVVSGDELSHVVPDVASVLNAGLEQALAGMNRKQRRAAIKQHELRVRKIFRDMNTKIRKITKKAAEALPSEE